MKLNIGCGYKHIHGFVNLDKAKEVLPDVCFDIENGLPFPENYFDYIYSEHTLEHIRPNKWIFVLNEIQRVAKNKCILEMWLPYDNILKRSHYNHYRTFVFTSFNQLFDGDKRNYYCKLKLKPLVKFGFFYRVFFYLFPLLKHTIKFKFEVVKNDAIQQNTSRERKRQAKTS